MQNIVFQIHSIKKYLRETIFQPKWEITKESYQQSTAWQFPNVETSDFQKSVHTQITTHVGYQHSETAYYTGLLPATRVLFCLQPVKVGSILTPHYVKKKTAKERTGPATATNEVMSKDGPGVSDVAGGNVQLCSEVCSIKRSYSLETFYR